MIGVATEERVATSWRAQWMLSVVLAAFVCEAEEPSTLQVSVRVDPVVEGTSFPAQVLVAFDSTGSGLLFFRVGFLCTPEAPFSTTVTFDAASGGPGSVDAFIVPVEPGAAVPCGALATPEPAPFPGEPAPPRATAGFVAVGGCGIGEVHTAAIVM